MYLHLGSDVSAPYSSVVGVFDLDNASWSGITREFLSRAEKQGRIVNITDDIPKSFVVCHDGDQTTVYLSQLATGTLLKRSMNSFGF